MFNGRLLRFFAVIRARRLVTRCVTSVGQTILNNAADLARTFLQTVSEAVSDCSLVPNTDETPCWFDLPPQETIDFKDVETVKSKTTGKEKLQFHLMSYSDLFLKQGSLITTETKETSQRDVSETV